jgi:hypothetical protein
VEISIGTLVWSAVVGFCEGESFCCIHQVAPASHR